MKIGIIVAMQSELSLLLPLVEGCESVATPGGTLYRGNVAGREVCVMQCGIGKVNAAAGAMTMIQRFTPDLMVSTGVAGGAGGDAGVMDVVVAGRTAYHDVWCGEPNLPGQVQGMPRCFEAPEWVTSLKCLAPRKGVLHGLTVTGDVFVDNAATLAVIKAKYPEALAVDMESAAIAHVCALHGVSFVSVRVVSDTPGEEHDNASQYRDFWSEAPRQTFSIIKELVAELPG